MKKFFRIVFNILSFGLTIYVRYRKEKARQKHNSKTPLNTSGEDLSKK